MTLQVKVGNRTKVTTTTTGTGTLNLGSAPTGFRSFAQEFTSGDQVYYVVIDDPDNPTAYEYGIGTYTAGTPDTLSRDTVFGSSNSDNKVSFAAGSKTVVSTPPAEMFSGGGPIPSDKFYSDANAPFGWELTVLSSGFGDDEGSWYTWNAYWDPSYEQWSRYDNDLIAFAIHFGPIPGEASTTHGINFWRALDSSYSSETPDRLIDPDFAVQGGWELLQTWTEFQTSAMGGGVLEGDGSGSTHGFARVLLPHNVTGTTWNVGLIWNAFPSRDDTDTTGDPSVFDGIEFDTSSGAVYHVVQYAGPTASDSPAGGAPIFSDVQRTRLDNLDLTQVSSGMLLKGPTTTYSAPLSDGVKTAVSHYLNGEADWFKVVLEATATDLGFTSGERVTLAGPPPSTTITGGMAFKLTATQYQLLLDVSGITLPNGGTGVVGGNTAIDPSKWKMEVTPYRLAAD